MLMSNERKILMKLDKERILDLFAKSSSELRKALLSEYLYFIPFRICYVTRREEGTIKMRN